MKLSEKAAKAVRVLLDMQGRTQEWLAIETGIPPRTLARRLHKSNPSSMSLDEMTAIAEVLGLDVVTLVAKAKETEVDSTSQPTNAMAA